jgi:nucleotide-binding universal stress UspA family protein
MDDRFGRIAVLFERGRNGTAALAAASQSAARSGAEMTVVVVAPQAPASHGCIPSAAALNCAVLDEATLELREAADLLAAMPLDVRYKLLVDDADPPFQTYVAREHFDLVMLPARRRLLPAGAGRHPAVRRLRRVAGCDVRVVADRESGGRER